MLATIIGGCGGSSVGKTGSTSAAVTGSSGPLTNLALIGYIDTNYLSGTGRGAHRIASRDFGDVAMNISYSSWTDQQGNTVSAPTGADISVQADAYSGPQILEAPVTFGPSTTPGIPDTNTDSRLFGSFLLEFNYLTTDAVPGLQIVPGNVWLITNGNMASDEQWASAFPDNTDNPSETAVQGFTPQTYPAYVRAFPGRFSSVTVRVDSNTVGLNFTNYTDPNGVAWGPSNPRGIWEATEFSTINFPSQSTPSFNSVLSDYLSFDISHMLTPKGYNLSTQPSQFPTVSANGGTVSGKRVYFSGDTYAISDITGSGNFYQLTKDISGTQTYLPGTYSTNQNLTGISIPSGEQGYLPGTYALTEINPSDPTFTSVILSLEGMFVDWTKMFPAPSQVMAITLPSSQDNNIQDMVLFKTNGGVITDFYYGYMDFEAYEFYLFPINTLVTAVPPPAAPAQGSVSWMPLGYFHGTISPSMLYNSTGAVSSAQTSIRSGSFKLDSPITWQDGTNSTFQTGRFIVYRR